MSLSRFPRWRESGDPEDPARPVPPKPFLPRVRYCPGHTCHRHTGTDIAGGPIAKLTLNPEDSPVSCVFTSLQNPASPGSGLQCPQETQGQNGIIRDTANGLIVAMPSSIPAGDGASRKRIGPSGCQTDINDCGSTRHESARRPHGPAGRGPPSGDPDRGEHEHHARDRKHTYDNHLGVPAEIAR